MNGQRGQLSKLVGRALAGLTAATLATGLALALLAPTAAASPIGDAEAAMMAAWDKAGGAASTLGARKGDVYPIGDGFALDFDGGKMYFTPATGAKYMFGPILDKYESLGGPAGSDLGFPTINEVPGLAGPDSRVSTFAASDNPVIFWTPDHGAFVVRGALNAAWDKLGSSGGVLGAPTGDETYDGEVATQKFTGGEVSWNRKTKEFATNPPALADQLKGLQIAIDPTAAINMAWRAAGGANGPLGAKKGGPNPIGGDGIVQEFNGGKIFFSPATGANAVEGPILQKYESLGGPVSSDLGFPVANEADGGITPASRIATFSAADKPVIFWTPEHGAFVVRGAMKAAWDKLKGATGKLGAPVGDQTVDGDVVSQKFTGGKVSWNRAKNTFTTDPANLASLLSGLQVSGQNQPSTSASPPSGKTFTFHWWWLAAVVPVLLLVLMVVLVVFGLRRRRAARELPAYNHGHDVAEEFGAGPDGRWTHDDVDYGSERFPPVEHHPEDHEVPEYGSPGRVSWSRAGGAAVEYDEHDEGAYVDDYAAGAEEDSEFGEYDEVDELEGFEDPDAVDTTPTPIVTRGAFGQLVEGGPEVTEAVSPEHFAVESSVPATQGPAAPDFAVPEAPPEQEFPDIFYPRGGPVEDEVPDVGARGAAETPGPRKGRHAAADDPGYAPAAAEAAYAAAPQAAVPVTDGAASRPTIHLPLDDDPYRAPDGYPIKASARFGLYYTPNSALYHDTLAELWFASETVAQANGFVRAD
ncbi:LGFP repeat-containing protein [Mycobacterium camsae]|uniref:LGFP repeat-containing protein n=1 Tax=Mycobacterium gordonae TaxID=1778 RepID=UPI00197EF731|nr:LGFP repeat-containing protein [Mycobacterium gordonae]